MKVRFLPILVNGQWLLVGEGHIFVNGLTCSVADEKLRILLGMQCMLVVGKFYLVMYITIFLF